MIANVSGKPSSLAVAFICSRSRYPKKTKDIKTCKNEILQADLAKSTTSIKVKITTISRLLNAIRVNLTQIYGTDGFTQYYHCFLSFIIISFTYFKLNKTNIANKVRSLSGNLVH